MKKIKMNGVPGYVLKTLIFCGVFALIFAGTFRVLWVWDSCCTVQGVRDFYALPENSVDVMALGGSGMKEFFSCTEAFGHNGIAASTLATPGQTFAAAKWLIEETEKTQHPKVYIIDPRICTFDDLNFHTVDIRLVTDSMKWSETRKDAIDELVTYYNELHPDDQQDLMDYYFSYSTYHSRWDDLHKEDFGVFTDYAQDFVIVTDLEDHDSLPPKSSEFGEQDITDFARTELNEVLDECRKIRDERGTYFLFLNPVYYGEEKHYERGNTIRKIIEDAGFAYLDMGDFEEAMGLDPHTDFYNWAHVNVSGAMKYTDYLADILKELYGLEDHRGDQNYDFWQKAYDSFRPEADAAIARIGTEPAPEE